MTEMHSDVYGVGPAPTPAKTGPGRTGYVLAAVILLVGIGAGIWGGFSIGGLVGGLATVSRVVAAFAAAGVCVVAALVIFVLTLVRRQKAGPAAAAPPWSTDSP